MAVQARKMNFPRGGEILVRLPNWVGDALMATPVLSNLTHHYEHLILLARPALVPLFKPFPQVKELIPVGPDKKDIFTCARKIKGRFQAGLLLPNSLSSALIFFLGRVKNRAGYAADARRRLLTHPIPRPKERLHQRDYYLHLLKALALEIKTQELRLPLSPAASLRAEALLTDLPRPRAGLAPGAAFGPAKKWPLSRFRALTYHLKRLGFSLVILGGPGERAAGEELVRDLPRARNLCGLTDLATAAAVINKLDLFVSNDSGLMHVAAALKRPQVAIFGSTDPALTGPLNPYAEVVAAKIDCSPCFSRSCSRGYQCFERIQVSDVLKACLKVYEGKNESRRLS